MAAHPGQRALSREKAVLVLGCLLFAFYPSEKDTRESLKVNRRTFSQRKLSNPTQKSNFQPFRHSSRSRMRFPAIFRSMGKADGKSNEVADPDRLEEFSGMIRGAFPSGMKYTIVSHDTPADTVEVRVKMDIGSIEERDGDNGLAHLMEHVTFQSADEAKVDGLLNSAGVWANALTDFHHTVYYGSTVHRDKLGNLIRSLSDIALDTSINDAKDVLDVERSALLAEISMCNTLENRQENDVLKDLHAETDLCGHIALGESEVIKRIDLDEVVDFYQRLYTPERAQLFLVGDIEPKEAEKIILEALDKTKYFHATHAAHPFKDIKRTEGGLPYYSHIYSSQRKGKHRRAILKNDPLASHITAAISTKEPLDPVRTRKEFRYDFVKHMATKVLERVMKFHFPFPTSTYSVVMEHYTNIAQNCQSTVLKVNAQEDEYQELFIEAVQRIKALYYDGVRDLDIDIIRTIASSYAERIVRSSTTEETIQWLMDENLVSNPFIGWKGKRQLLISMLQDVTNEEIRQEVKKLLEPYAKYADMDANSQIAGFLVISPHNHTDVSFFEKSLAAPYDPSILSEEADEEKDVDVEDFTILPSKTTVTQAQTQKPSLVPLDSKNSTVIFDEKSGVACFQLNNGIRINHKSLEEDRNLEPWDQRYSIKAVFPGGLYHETLEDACALRVGYTCLVSDGKFAEKSLAEWADKAATAGANISVDIESEQFAVEAQGSMKSLSTALEFIQDLLTDIKISKKSLKIAKSAWEADFQACKRDVSAAATNTLCGVISRWDKRVIVPSKETLKPLTVESVTRSLRSLFATHNIEINIASPMPPHVISKTFLESLGSVRPTWNLRPVMDPSFAEIHPEDIEKRKISQEIDDSDGRAIVVLGQLCPSLSGCTLMERAPFSGPNGTWSAGRIGKANKKILQDEAIIWKRSHELYIPVCLSFLEIIAGSDMHQLLREELGVAYAVEFEITKNRRHSSSLWCLEVSTTRELAENVAIEAIEALESLEFDDMQLLGIKSYLLRNHRENLQNTEYWLEMMEGLQQDTAKKTFNYINDFEKIVKSITVGDLADVWGTFNANAKEIVKIACISRSSVDG